MYGTLSGFPRAPGGGGFGASGGAAAAAATARETATALVRVRMGRSLNQFADRLAVAQDGNRPAGAVFELVPVVHPEVLVDGRQEIPRRQRSVLRVFAPGR